MRIIAGELKGRRLVTPADNRVRPTTDKVKEAVFSMISAYLPDSVVVDLFAGTGNLGLEAISRGAKRAYFIDRDRASIAMVRENVKYCKVEDRSVIIWSDYVAGLKKINDKVDVIFLDPPYVAGFIDKCLEAVAESDILLEDGIIVAEHSAKDEVTETAGGFVKVKSKRYGSINITVYEKQEAEA